MTEYLTREVAEEDATLTEEIEVPTADGTKTVKIDVKEASVADAEALEEREADGESETELVQEVLDEYVVRPEGLSVEELGAPTVEAIMRGVFRAWGAGDDVAEALSDREGN